MAISSGGQDGSGRLYMLDGIRGIAAIEVVIFHAQIVFGGFCLFNRGYLCVDLFLILSGFVLTLSAEPKMATGLSGLGFFRLRILRLWPMVVLGLAGGTLFQLVAGDMTGLPLLIVAALLSIPALWRSDGALPQMFPINSPQWSIHAELIANLAHGLFLRRLSNGGLIAIIAASGLILAVLAPQRGNLGIGAYNFDVLAILPVIFATYTFGVLLARNFKPTRTLPAVPWWFALMLPSLILLALPVTGLDWGSGDWLAIMVLLPASFWLATKVSAPTGARKWLAELGDMSFPLYAVHVPILQAVSLWGTGRLHWFLGVSIALLAGLLLAQTNIQTWRPGKPLLRARKGSQFSPTVFSALND
ncbi:MAG: acyltransferase [Novosphingobium sp.]